MNREAVRQNKPLVDCAMYELEAQITTIIPGETACLSCLYPEHLVTWKKRFPLYGAVSGTIALLGAIATIKLISGFGEPLTHELLNMEVRTMNYDLKSDT